MSLFGEKCARCGKKRTRKEFEGVPTCDECQHSLEMKLAASKESPRACPIDASPMQKEIVLNVVVDRCLLCKGVWLDVGELELLRGTIAGGSDGERAERSAVPAGVSGAARPETGALSAAPRSRARASATS